MFTKSDTVHNSPWSEVGSVTPLRSAHPTVFDSNLSQISEDSSCSVASCDAVVKEAMEDNITQETKDITNVKSETPINFGAALDKHTSACSNLTDTGAESGDVSHDNMEELEVHKTSTRAQENLADETTTFVQDDSANELKPSAEGESVEVKSESDLKSDEIGNTETNST